MKRQIALGLLTASLLGAIGSGASALEIKEVVVNSAATTLDSRLLLPPQASIPVAMPGTLPCSAWNTTLAVPVTSASLIQSPALIEGSAIRLHHVSPFLSIQRRGFDRFYHWF